GSHELYLYFHLSKFIHKKKNEYYNQGEVRGYISPNFREIDDNDTRLKNRRLVYSKSIDPKVREGFKIENEDLDGKYRDEILYDLGGRYDLVEPHNLLVLRYLDFVPLVSISENENIVQYSPPKGYRYTLYLVNSKGDKVNIHNGF